LASENVRELRFISKELRAAAGDSPKLVGLAARFNSPAQIGDGPLGFMEVILPGAFSATLAGKADVRALFNHNPDHVLGRSTNGTLRLWESSLGLQFECDLPQTAIAVDVYKMVQRGDVSQCSFGFIPTSEHWTPSPTGGLPTREIQACDLLDISAVTYPSYVNTSVQARSAMFPAGSKYVDRLAARAKALTTIDPAVKYPELASDAEKDALIRRAFNLRTS
jgi:Escherichia/Staphylococcus phage prohead protease